MTNPSTTRSCGGFSLIEVLISLAITLVAMALVFQTSRMLVRVYESQSRVAELSSAATLAFDDIVVETTRAGYGLGAGVDCVVGSTPGNPPGPGQITLRSNPSGVSATLRKEARASGEDVPVSNGSAFQPGDLVLLADLGGNSERAEVISSENDQLQFRSAENPSGELQHIYSPHRGARVLKLREVRYFMQAAPDGNVLIKEVRGPNSSTRTLARQVDELAFEYLDRFGNPLSSARIEASDLLSTIRITLRFTLGPASSDKKALSTSVTLDRQSSSVDFAESGIGLRLARYFHPIDSPTGVANRPFEDWGIILSAGHDPGRDRSYLYTFMAERRALDARVESVTWLDDVRDPIALVFGPEKSPVAGSLFVASSGLRIGHLSRIYPDSYGVFSPESRIETFERTDALAQIGGITFGVDDALYVASSEKAKIFGFRFDVSGKPEGPTEVAKVVGSPGAIVQGADGALYFLVEQTRSSSLWKIPFDETLSPREPVEVSQLPGKGISLALEPLSGNLFVLLRERLGDFVVTELTRRWLRRPTERINTVFSLEDFRERTQKGDTGEKDMKASTTMVLSARLPSTLIPERLDFLAFDDLGLLYLGAYEQDLVLKFDLDRSDTRHAVDIAGVVEDSQTTGTSSKVRLHAWRRNP